jgi:hypothetical protein
MLTFVGRDEVANAKGKVLGASVNACGNSKEFGGWNLRMAALAKRTSCKHELGRQSLLAGHATTRLNVCFQFKRAVFSFLYLYIVLLSVRVFFVIKVHLSSCSPQVWIGEI